MSIIEKAVARLNKPDVTTAPLRQKAPVINNLSYADQYVDPEKAICQLDITALREQGYLTPAAENSQFAEEYRIIKRPILANAFGRGAAPVDLGNLIMVTSSVPGEGKTFTSMNLALSIALERDTTVLLIDGDMINPQLSRLLALDNEPGLMDVLDNPTVGLEDVIINTDIPSLRVVSAGLVSEQSTELLASNDMDSLATELSARYHDRIIIIDAPPFLNTTQAKVLARFAGQIMFVIEAGVTNRNAIIEATSQVDDSKVVGLILNKCKVAKKNFYGGYYGTYGGE